ncbi:unnamed protein product, partial [Fusarium fujikuroi]
MVRGFASGTEDGIIEIVDMTRPGDSLLTLEGHDSPVYALVFSPSGKRLATQCAFFVKIWNIEALGECVHTFQDLRLAITCHWSMAFSTDDYHLHSVKERMPLKFMTWQIRSYTNLNSNMLH